MMRIGKLVRFANNKNNNSFWLRRFNFSTKFNEEQSKSFIVLTGNRRVDEILDKGKLKLFEVMSIYEEAIGLKEIKEAQQSVLEAERKFVEAQKFRRQLNLEILDVQAKLRNLRDEMDRISKTDSRYLQLFTEEHNILKNEVNLMNEFKIRENEERDLFFFLSASLRDSQEKERARVERIKYLQLGLSIACTVLGIISAFTLSYFRNSNIREILTHEKVQFKNTNELIEQILDKQNQTLQLTINQKNELDLTNKNLNELKSFSKENFNKFQKEDLESVNNQINFPIRENSYKPEIIISATTLLLGMFFYLTQINK